MSTDRPFRPVPNEKPGYINARGTIYKVRGGEPLQDKTPAEQKKETLQQQAFIALRIGYSRRVARERIAAKLAEQKKAAGLSPHFDLMPPNLQAVALAMSKGGPVPPADPNAVIRNSV